MPIYEYRCDSCGFQKEYIQRMSDALLTDCPECKKSTFSKMVTAAGFQLKGGGWYVTDFKSGGSHTAGAAKKTEGAQKDAGGSSESAKSESGKSESGKSESGKSESTKSESSAASSTSAAAPAASSTPAPSSSA